MERFLAQQVLIEAVVSDFAGFRRRLTFLLNSPVPDAVRTAIGNILGAMRTPVYAQELDPERRGLVGDRVVVLEGLVTLWSVAAIVCAPASVRRRHRPRSAT